MLDEDIVAIVGFFLTVIIVVVGLPLARAWARAIDRRSSAPAVPADVTQRLERIEQAVDAMSIEVERISENQRFTTRLLSEGAPRAALPTARLADAADARISEES